MTKLMKKSRQRFLWIPLFLFLVTAAGTLFLFENNNISGDQFDLGMALSLFFLTALCFLWAYWGVLEKAIYLRGWAFEQHTPHLYWATILAIIFLGVICVFHGVKLWLS